VIQAYEDAAEHVDDKWARAWAQGSHVRRAVAAYLDVQESEIALAQNTHELVSRFLSALDWSKPKIVTTDGEFHSMRRQLSRLEEESVEIVWVPSSPVDTLAERLSEAVDAKTAALMVSSVLFQNSAVVPHLGQAAEVALSHGCEVLFDAYHGFCALPNTTPEISGLPVFVVGGGYKYAQWGEGACWMRIPQSCGLRPVYTGWFSDFAALDAVQSGPIRYGETPADRFAGSTYDPTSHYRAARVIDFFRAQGMDTDTLRQRSLAQTDRLIRGLDGFDVITPLSTARGGFVSVRLENTDRVVAALRRQGVFVDARADILRLGPAPYTTDDEIDRAIAALKSICSI